MADIYTAIYEIDHGVEGFGGCSPDRIERVEQISAENGREAFKKAFLQAREFALNYFPNPITEVASVKLLSLKDPKGNTLDQPSFLGFENGCVVVKYSFLEQELILASRKKDQVSS